MDGYSDIDEHDHFFDEQFDSDGIPHSDLLDDFDDFDDGHDGHDGFDDFDDHDDHDVSNVDLSSQIAVSDIEHDEEDEEEEEEGDEGHSGDDEEAVLIRNDFEFSGSDSDVSTVASPHAFSPVPSSPPLSAAHHDFDTSSDIDDHSSGATNRSWTADSDSDHSDEEGPSSPDSLFVRQLDAGRRDGFDEIHHLQQQARLLTRRHAELAQIANDLHRSVAERREALRRRAFAPRPIIPRRRRFGEDEFERHFDELVEMEVAGANARRANRTPGPARQPAVIDLTEEPDSPEDVVFLPNPRNRRGAGVQEPQPRNRNPRRQGSLNHRTPSLARSDGSILGAPLIDLTDMDDDEAPANANGDPGRAGQNPPPRPIALPRVPALVNLIDDDEEPANNANNGMFGIVRRVGGIGGMRGGLAEFNFISRLFGQGPVDVQILGPQLNNDNPVANPLGHNLPNFNYRANGYNNEPPKPAHVPPPAAREGFSRATGEDLAFVCPSCEEELKYDPDEEEPQGPPTKRARNRKDREVHHFWAVKECGHVYCRACYDHRRSGARSTHKTNFRHQEGRRVVICAVADCPSEVSTKTAWVGLFL